MLVTSKCTLSDVSTCTQSEVSILLVTVRSESLNTMLVTVTSTVAVPEVSKCTLLLLAARSTLLVIFSTAVRSEYDTGHCPKLVNVQLSEVSTLLVTVRS